MTRIDLGPFALSASLGPDDLDTPTIIHAVTWQYCRHSFRWNSGTVRGHVLPGLSIRILRPGHGDRIRVCPLQVLFSVGFSAFGILELPTRRKDWSHDVQVWLKRIFQELCFDPRQIC